MKKIIISVIIVLLLYSIYALYYYIDVNLGKEWALTSNLYYISEKISGHIEKKKTELPKNRSDLEKLLDVKLSDPFTGEYLEYIPDNMLKTNLLPIISQKDYYRTSVWPFGEYKKYAIMNKPGMIHPLYKKDEK